MSQCKTLWLPNFLQLVMMTMKLANQYNKKQGLIEFFIINWNYMQPLHGRIYRK